MHNLDLAGVNEITFKILLDKLATKLTNRSREVQLKFCFDLFDVDNNGKICLRDLEFLNREFAGVCHLLHQDYVDISKFVKLK